MMSCVVYSVSDKEVIFMPKDNGFVPFLHVDTEATESLVVAQECENCDCYDCNTNCEECDSK